MENLQPRPPPNHQLLPDDPVLEIVVRCGTTGDAIRCAAASKSLRRSILDAPFLRHLRGFLNNGGEHGDGRGRPFFIPTLLLGLYHESGDPRLQPSFVPASDDATKQGPSLAALLPPPNHHGDVGACEFGPYLPVASHRSLLVLRRRCGTTATEHLIKRHGRHPIELSVCNPITGARLELPPHHVQDLSHALLDVDLLAPSWSFKLLVAELSNGNPSTLHVQIISSDSEQGHGVWGPALACPITSRFGESSFELGTYYGGRRPPVVLGDDTICWLCTSVDQRGEDRVLTWCWRGGVARPACIVSPPPGYSLSRAKKCLAVLPSPADAGGSHTLLGMIILANFCDIQVWACENRQMGSARDWTLWHRIKEVAIPQPMSSRPLRAADLSLLSSGHGVQLLHFCEESGTLFLRSNHVLMRPLLFSVDMSKFLCKLENKEVSKLDAREWKLNRSDATEWPDPYQELDFCPYEVDLLSHMRLICSRTAC